jgi:hypothetical protein
MRRTLCAAALAWLAWTGSALPAVASPEPGPVQVVAPAAGTVLQAGSLAELEWTPLAAFEELADVQDIKEWEAFLSLDGGAHYTVRVTPHLDHRLRRAVWQVPATPTSDARLLLRFGDEHRETVVELPQRFAIAGPVTGHLDFAPARLSFGRGEPALPGAAGVVAWVEGDRRGDSARPVVAAEPPSAHSGSSVSEARSDAAVGEVPPRRASDPAAGQPPTGQLSTPPRTPATLTAERTAQTPDIPILLQSRRRNE